MVESTSSSVHGAWPSLGPRRLGEVAHALMHVANTALATYMTESASSSSAPLSFRWGFRGRRDQTAWISTPKGDQLQLLLRENHALECALRREEIPIRWNTVQVQWGAGVLWQGLQHRPGRTAVMSLGPQGRLKGTSSISALVLPDVSQSRDSLWLVDAAACELEVLDGREWVAGGPRPHRVHLPRVQWWYPRRKALSPQRQSLDDPCTNV